MIESMIENLIKEEKQIEETKTINL